MDSAALSIRSVRDEGRLARARVWMAAHPVISHVIRRLSLYVVTLWAAMSATFIFFHLIPGNPIQAYVANLSAATGGGSGASAAAVAHYDKVFGLDGNMFQQYLHYWYQMVIGHDLGVSLVAYPTPAWQLIADALPWTLGLLGISTVLGWVLGMLLGAVAGWWRGSRTSSTLTYLAAGLSHIPYYFIALIGLFLLAYKFTVLPAEQPYSAGLTPGLSWRFIASVIDHGTLPALSIVIVALFAWMLGMRMQMIMTLGEDYLTFAKAKGLSSMRIMRSYAMRNSILPELTGLAIGFGTIFSGNVLVEQLFNYPGLGNLLVLGVKNLDFNVVMGITNVAVFAVLTGAFVLDLVMPVIDPRIRRGQ